VERRPLNRRYLAVAGLIALVVIVAAAMYFMRSTDRQPGTVGIFNRGVRAPEDTRIRVEVLNATKTRGLARRATAFLRDRGFDVVATGTSSEALDSTIVLDRSNHPEWAALVAKSLGNARVESRPDSSRYLDVTVLLGASWRPPAEPFYP
jgi:hypothetical protein